MNENILSSTLKSHTSKQWIELVLKDFPLFIADHASNERKAASTAMDFVVRYPDKLNLVEKAAKIAQQEIAHFRQVFKRMKKHRIPLRPDEKSRYIENTLKQIRGSTSERLMDRILFAAVIEMRGQERFELLAHFHPDQTWRDFFSDLAISETNHHLEYLSLGYELFTEDEINQRWQEVLEAEGKIFRELPETYRLFT